MSKALRQKLAKEIIDNSKKRSGTYDIGALFNEGQVTMSRKNLEGVVANYFNKSGIVPKALTEETINLKPEHLNWVTFGEALKKLAGKEISITGYMIPMDPMGITYVLSRNPNSTCFFCGGAGPETVLQLNMKPSAIKRYKTDDKLTFKGILQLNEKDIHSLTYVLEEAEEL